MIESFRYSALCERHFVGPVVLCGAGDSVGPVTLWGR
jgi:hypothetical protein